MKNHISDDLKSTRFFKELDWETNAAMAATCVLWIVSRKLPKLQSTASNPHPGILRREKNIAGVAFVASPMLSV